MLGPSGGGGVLQAVRLYEGIHMPSSRPQGSEGPGHVAGREQSHGPPFVFPAPETLRNLACFMIQTGNRLGWHLGLVSDS